MLGYVPFDRTGAELLWKVLAKRHHRRATVVATKLAFSECVHVFGDDEYPVALLDRPAEGAHALTHAGASHRARRRHDGQ